VTYETLESGSISRTEWVVKGTAVEADPTHMWTNTPACLDPVTVVEVDTSESDRYTIDDEYPRVFRVADRKWLCQHADAATTALNKGKLDQEILKSVYGCSISYTDAGYPVAVVETDKWAFNESDMDDFEPI